MCYSRANKPLHHRKVPGTWKLRQSRMLSLQKALYWTVRTVHQAKKPWIKGMREWRTQHSNAEPEESPDPVEVIQPI